MALIIIHIVSILIGACALISLTVVHGLNEYLLMAALVPYSLTTLLATFILRNKLGKIARDLYSKVCCETVALFLLVEYPLIMEHSYAAVNISIAVYCLFFSPLLCWLLYLEHSDEEKESENSESESEGSEPEFVYEKLLEFRKIPGDKDFYFLENCGEQLYEGKALLAALEKMESAGDREYVGEQLYKVLWRKANKASHYNLVVGVPDFNILFRNLELFRDTYTEPGSDRELESLCIYGEIRIGSRCAYTHCDPYDILISLRPRFKGKQYSTYLSPTELITIDYVTY